jgi:hypothetical protein
VSGGSSTLEGTTTWWDSGIRKRVAVRIVRQGRQSALGLHGPRPGSSLWTFEVNYPSSLLIYPWVVSASEHVCCFGLACACLPAFTAARCWRHCCEPA